MKKIIFLLSVLITSFANSQQIEWGTLEKGKGRVGSIIPFDENGFFTSRFVGGALTGSLQLSFHQNLGLVTIEKINTKVPTGSASIESISKLGDQIIVFLSDKDNGANILYYQTYSRDCLPTSEPIEVLSYEVPKGLRMRGGYSIMSSLNNEFLVLEYSIPGKKEETDRFGYKVMNKSMEVVYSGEYTAEYDTREFDVASRYLSDKGEYFLLCKVYNTNSRGKVKDRSSLEKTVLTRASGAKMESMEIVLDGDKSVTDLSFFQDEKGQIRIVGMFGYQGAYTSGIFYLKVNFDSKSVEQQSYNQFEKDFITEGMSDRAKKKADKKEAKGKGAPQLSQFDFSRTYVSPDGTVTGIMEQYYIIVVTHTDSKGNTTTTYYYHYNDLVVYKINPEGEFVLTKKIRKEQVSANDGGYYSSFASYISGNDLHIFFNDNMKNYSEGGEFLNPATSRELQTASYRKKSNVVAEAVVSLENGNVSRNIAFKREETEAYAVPKKFAVDYNHNTMLMFLQLGKKEKFGIIKL